MKSSLSLAVVAALLCGLAKAGEDGGAEKERTVEERRRQEMMEKMQAERKRMMAEEMERRAMKEKFAEGEFVKKEKFAEGEPGKKFEFVKERQPEDKMVFMKGPPNTKLSVKLADGTYIEADGAVLMTGMGQQIMDRVFDPAKEGLLAYKLGRDISPDAVDKATKLLAEMCPKAKVKLDPDVKLLIISSDDEKELRRAVALLRALRPEQQQMMMKPMGGPGEKFEPKKEREAPPGDF